MTESNVTGGRRLSQFLRMAVMAGVESAVQIHIQRGDDLNARDAGGMTPLMLSAARNKPAICKLLLSAGADHGLLDPSGRTAFDIAVAAKADAAIEILNAVRTPITPFSSSSDTAGFERQASSATARPLHLVAGVAPPVDSLEVEIAASAPAQKSASLLAAGTEEHDGEEFDVSGWEAEEESPRPEIDRLVADSASAIQIAITTHEPIDSSAEWDDIDASLPELALPLARSDNYEGRAKLRLLLLRAVREGSVPAFDVRAQSANEDGSVNTDAEAFLTMVVNDLNAEVDERFEYANTGESFEVFVDPEETPDEEASLDEALFAIDHAASPRHEPLRIYQREFQPIRLLTADEEIRLAKDMEAALDKALDALATWPDGLASTLAAGAQAIAGTRQLSSIWVGGEPDPEPDSAESPEATEPPEPALEAVIDTDGEPLTEMAAHAAAFANALQQLSSLLDGNIGPTDSRAVRLALENLRLNRRFLVELMETSDGSAPCMTFRGAMADFRKARDRMVSANLKLAFHHAKKALYSGELLDDLAQEGNIGLLKAVDRYDWRRGFRFSTYATWWIRQHIGRHVADKVRTIRIPAHLHEKLNRVERAARALEKETGQQPMLDELAKRVEMPRHKLEALLRIPPEPSPIEELTVDRMIAIDARDSYTSPDPAHVVDKRQLNRAVDRYISSLSTKDRKEERILRLRFGVGVSEAMTLDEVGTLFELTRERIRQIEGKAIKKLRHPVRSEPFARTVLGLEPEDNPLASDAHVSDGEDGSGAPGNVPPPAAPKRHPASRSSRKLAQPPDAPKPSELDRVLAQAIELGIRVDDERPSYGRLWVELIEAHDLRHRKLARRLLEVGFAFWPGKGYWK